MPTFDTNSFVNAVLTDAKNLAATLFKNYAEQAEADTRAFLQASQDTIAQAASLYQQDQIDKDELEDLINDQKVLAEMHALKNAGLASAAVDTFVDGVINIMIDAAFAALKI
jgi:argininosuccinate lyase